MKNEDAIKWLENLKQDIGQLRHEDLWPYAQAIDEIIATMEQEAVEPLAIKQEMFDEFYGAVSCCPKCDCMWVMYMENDMHYCPECGQAVKWE